MLTPVLNKYEEVLFTPAIVPLPSPLFMTGAVEEPQNGRPSERSQWA